MVKFSPSHFKSICPTVYAQVQGHRQTDRHTTLTEGILFHVVKNAHLGEDLMKPQLITNFLFVVY